MEAGDVADYFIFHFPIISPCFNYRGWKRGEKKRENRVEHTNKNNTKRKNHSGEQKQILRLLVQDRGLLEDTPPSRTGGEEIEELDDDQINKIDGRRFIGDLCYVVWVVFGGHVAIFQDHGAEGDSFSLLFFFLGLGLAVVDFEGGERQLACMYQNAMTKERKHS